MSSPSAPETCRTGIRISLPGAIILLVTTLLFCAPLTASTAPTIIRKQHITLADGATTIVKGELRGCESVSYLISARAGQRLKIRLSANNEENYLNIYTPGKGPGDEALHAGAISDNLFDGTLPESGEYTVSVYLMRNAARKNEQARYTLNITLSGGNKTSKP